MNSARESIGIKLLVRKFRFVPTSVGFLAPQKSTRLEFGGSKTSRKEGPLGGSNGVYIHMPTGDIHVCEVYLVLGLRAVRAW